MNTAGLSEIRREVRGLDAQQAQELLLRMARYKKENKELLAYLLFDADNEQAFISDVKADIDVQFGEINKGNIYYAKKSIRKILRTANKYIKYSGLKNTEADILIHFCHALRSSGIRYRSNTTLTNLYDRQLARIRKAVSSLHEDLQHDFADAIADLEG